MKRFLSFVLAVFMLMSTMPSASGAIGKPELACMSKCCLSNKSKKETPQKQSKKEKNCCKDCVCAPFLLCKITFGYEASDWNCNIASYNNEKNYAIPVTATIPDVYLSDCWQPPELS